MFSRYPGRAAMSGRGLRSMMAPGAFLAMLLAGCGDLFTDPAPPEPASLAVSFTIANAAGADLATAYDKADRVSIRVARQGSVILEETRDFTPAAETRITISLDDVQGAEAVSVALELMLGAAPLFRGSTQVTLAPGAVTPAQLALVPVPAGVRVDPVPELTSLGETAVLSATALFATGDPLPGALLDWVSSNPAVAEVSSGGVVTARGEGSAEVRAAHEGLAGTVSVSVRQAVAGLTLLPPTATLGIDQAMAFAVEPRDARAHPIHGRSVNWATSHPSIASISSAGVATGLAEGTASVIASVDGHLVVGSVSVRRIARIVLSTAAVEFDMVAGGAIPVGRRVTVDNGEAGLLSRLTLGAVRYGAGASGWLTANLTAGTAPAELTLSVSGAQIPPGTYTATVAVESPVALNSPAEVAVTLTVAPPPLLAVGLSQLGFSATAGGQDPAVQSIAVVNAGGGVITDLGLGTVEYGGGASGWLHATLSGSTAPATLTVSAATGALPPGTYTAKLPLRSAALGQEKLIGVSFTVAPGAIIHLSPAGLTFAAVAGHPNPPARTVDVTNAGLSTLTGLGVSIDYGAGASGWLTANLTAATAPAELTLSVSSMQLPPGTYSATVAVQSPVALNSSAEVAVTLTVAPPPLLAVGLSQLGFSATAGGQDPAVQSIAVVNAGGGVITDMGLGTVEYGGGASGWLHATLSGSTAPATLTVSAATGALPPGTYTAKLPLRSAALGQEKLIGVSFTVAPGAIIHLSPAGLTFAAVAGHPNPPARTVNVTNAGLSTLTGLGVSIDYGAGASGWLTANLSSTSAPATLTISAAAGQLPPGSYSAQVILSSPVAANAAQVLNVAFQVTAPPLIVLETGQIEILFVPDWEVPEYPQRRVSISNGGGGTLSDLSVGTIEYGPGAAGWLDAWIDEEGGAALVLQVVPADFHAGVYSATVQVESPSAANSPEYVEVILTLIGLPEAETGAASGITQQSAVVEATVLANAPATAVWIEWGTDEQELSNASASLTISFDEDPSNIIFALNGLVPGTRYYYQAVAENEAGEARGDIRDFMTLLPPPVSFWQADGDYSDSSGPNHGSPTENVYFSPDGFKGSAFEFHGDWSPGAVTAPGVGIDDASAFTLSVWVNLSHDAGSSSVLRFITLGNEKAVLRMDGYYENFGALPNALHFYVFTDGGGGGIRTEPLLNQRECYYHVAGTFDGALLRLYLDGVEVGSVASAGGASIAGNGVRLSSNDFEGMFGLLDEVGIYDRALSADAIRSLYEAPGSGQRCGVPE